VSALDKVLKLAGPPAPPEDPAGLLVLTAQQALDGVLAYLAGSDDDEDSGGDSDHSSHSTFKALVKRGMDKKKAGGMCAKADNRVKASRLAARARSALGELAVPEGVALSATELEAAPSVADDRAAAAVLTELSQGLGLPAAAGPGLEAIADVVALAKPVGDGNIIMNHGPFTGTHQHTHFQSSTHAHPHQHFGDNTHEGGPQHRPGSKPGGRPGW
jgi:hypothetical protein